MIVKTTLDTAEPAVSTDAGPPQASTDGLLSERSGLKALPNAEDGLFPNPAEGGGIPFEDDEALLEEALLEEEGEDEDEDEEQ